MSIRSLLERDARLSDQLRVAEKPGLLRKIAVFFAHSGDSWFWGLALVIFWWISGPSWRKWELVEFAGIALLAVIVQAVKFIVRRQRPEGDWGGIYRNTDPNSFPSGHAARAFLIAVIASAFGPFWLVLILCVWAPLVAVARVAMGVHYLSDVIAGAVLGIVVALIWLQFHQPFLSWFTVLTGVSLG